MFGAKTNFEFVKSHRTSTDEKWSNIGPWVVFWEQRSIRSRGWPQTIFGAKCSSSSFDIDAISGSLAQSYRRLRPSGHDDMFGHDENYGRVRSTLFDWSDVKNLAPISKMTNQWHHTLRLWLNWLWLVIEWYDFDSNKNGRQLLDNLLCQ